MALPVLKSFSATGSTQQYPVPSDVTAIEADVRGAGSGSANGGRVKGQFAVTGGETLYITVGVNPGGSISGGFPSGGDGGSSSSGDGNGGGGHSDVRQGGSAFSNIVAVAGGAGGSGDTNAPGGAGGADTGQDGTSDDGDAEPGKGGTQTAGGAGGGDGTDGAQPDGGTGGDAGAVGAGGGGGGWYGGGGGESASLFNQSDDEAGGGGGSNRTDPLATVSANQRGCQSGDGEVILRDASPRTPTDVSQSVVGDETINLSWSPDPDDQGDRFRIQVSEDGGPFTDVATVNSSTTTFQYAADASTNSHEFRVRSETDAASSAYITTATVTTDPTGLSVTDPSGDGISLSWSAPDQADGQRILRAPATGTTASDYTTVATVGGTAESFVDRSLIDGGRAFYRVQATYSGGANSQLTAEVRTRRPFFPPPVGLSLDSLTATDADLSWSDHANTESRYVLERRRDYPDGSFGPVRDAATVGPDTETATDTGVVPERLHEFQVRGERDETVLRIDDSDTAGVATASTPVAVEFGDGASLRFGLGDGQPIGRIDKS